jgi:hypothetical protein
MEFCRGRERLFSLDGAGCTPHLGVPSLNQHLFFLNKWIKRRVARNVPRHHAVSASALMWKRIRIAGEAILELSIAAAEGKRDFANALKPRSSGSGLRRRGPIGKSYRPTKMDSAKITCKCSDIPFILSPLTLSIIASRPLCSIQLSGCRIGSSQAFDMQGRSTISARRSALLDGFSI